jgi:hypothetical protein
MDGCGKGGSPAGETILKATPLILLACVAWDGPVHAGNCSSPTKAQGGRPGNRAVGAADAASGDDADGPAQPVHNHPTAQGLA